MNKLQSTNKINKEGDIISGQTFNLPILKCYTTQEAWNYLRSFHLTTRSERLEMLNWKKPRFLYLVSLPSSVHKTTLNLIEDQIALLEKTFEFSIWFEPNKNLSEAQITYLTDEE